MPGGWAQLPHFWAGVFQRCSQLGNGGERFQVQTSPSPRLTGSLRRSGPIPSARLRRKKSDGLRNRREAIGVVVVGRFLWMKSVPNFLTERVGRMSAIKAPLLPGRKNAVARFLDPSPNICLLHSSSTTHVRSLFTDFFDFSPQSNIIPNYELLGW